VPTPAPPVCADCNGPISLITAIEGFFERPAVRIFKCESCFRLVMFFLEDGQLRKA
jgi:hypothetical protein